MDTIGEKSSGGLSSLKTCLISGCWKYLRWNSEKSFLAGFSVRPYGELNPPKMLCILIFLLYLSSVPNLPLETHQRPTVTDVSFWPSIAYPLLPVSFPPPYTSIFLSSDVVVPPVFSTVFIAPHTLLRCISNSPLLLRGRGLYSRALSPNEHEITSARATWSRGG
jgi:hypothetical protein